MNKEDAVSVDAKDLALECRKIMDAGKAENIIQLHVTEYSVLADYFVLATANSVPHLKAIMERLKREISRKYGCKPRIDGKAESLWIVIDYGNVVIHVLSPEMREAYQLESLWGDAPSETHIENLTNKAPK